MPQNILPHGLHKTCWLLLLTVLLFLVTLSAPYWVPHDPYLQNLDLALQAPNAEYPFGTDRYGRCVFSRVLVGGQSSIFSALALVGIIFTTGTAAGLWSGYYGGKLDNFIMRLSDIFLAFPGLVFAIAVASIPGRRYDKRCFGAGCHLVAQICTPGPQSGADCPAAAIYRGGTFERLQRHGNNFPASTPFYFKSAAGNVGT